MTNVVLSSYFVGQPDPQRGRHLEADTEAVRPMAESVRGAQVVVLNDCWKHDRFVHFNAQRVEAPEPAYRQRWLSQWQWLRRYPEVKWVWLVDATDTEMLREPWDHMQPGVLYVGSENQQVGCPWMYEHSRAVGRWMRTHAREPLLNCGIVGGDRETVMKLCMRMNDLWVQTRADAMHEMAFFNIAAREIGCAAGPDITTEFKKYEDNGQAWWRHK